MKKEHDATEEMGEENVFDYPEGWKKTLSAAVACTVLSAIVVYAILSFLGKSLVSYRSNTCEGHTNADRWWDTCSLTSTSSFPIGWIAASTLSCLITSLIFIIAVVVIKGDSRMFESNSFQSLIRIWRRLFTSSYLYTLVLYAVLLPFGAGEPRLSFLYVTISLVGAAFFFMVVRCGYEELVESNNSLQTNK